jgi:hypothetical protein
MGGTSFCSSPSTTTTRKHLSYQQSIHYLERKFHRIENGIKALVRRKAKLLLKLQRQRRVSKLFIRSKHQQDDLPPQQLNILHLPDELLLHIFTYLNGKDILTSLIHVCYTFTNILLDETLWKPLYHHHWVSQGVLHHLERSDDGDHDDGDVG